MPKPPIPADRFNNAIELIRDGRRDIVALLEQRFTLTPEQRQVARAEQARVANRGKRLGVGNGAYYKMDGFKRKHY